MRLAQSVALALLICLLLAGSSSISALSLGLPGSRAATGTTQGSCFPQGNIVLNVSTTWKNLSCTHAGEITVAGSVVFTMIDSSLQGNGSAIRLYNETQGSLVGSTISNAEIFLNDNANFSATNSSLSLTSFISQDYPVLTLDHSNVDVASGRLNATVSAYSLDFVDSTFTYSDATRLSIIANNVTISSSSIEGTTTSFEAMIIAGSQELGITNSTVSAESSSPTARASLSLSGGTVDISNSVIEGSGIGYYGYPPVSSSNVTIDSSNDLSVSDSKILSGQVSSAVGVYQNSEIQLQSLGDISLAGSTIQSIAVHGSSLSVLAAYSVVLNDSILYCPSSNVTIATYSLTSYDSRIAGSLNVGGGEIANADLFNTTVSAVSGKSYYVYGRFLAHVVSSASTEANVTVLDPTTGVTTASVLTNSSGWAEAMLLLYQGANSTSGQFSCPYYIVEVTQGSYKSSQILMPSNNTFTATFYVDPGQSSDPPAPNEVILPITYGFLRPTSFMEFISNSYPLDLFNNASYSTVDFRTVGSSGYSFYFQVVYPANLSATTPSVLVDGATVSSSIGKYNSSYNYVNFTIPSGDHYVVISYVAPGGYYIYQVAPYFYPNVLTIAIVAAFSIVASAFLIHFVRRQRRFEHAALLEDPICNQ